MRIGRRHAVGLFAVLTYGLLSACSAITAGPGAGDPNPSVTLLPADQVAFTVSGSPGFTPVVFHALAAPTVAIYGDGRVIVAVPDPDFSAVPPTYELHRIDPAAVARFVAGVEASGLVDKSTDYGQPRVTDLGSLLVSVHGSQDEQSISVYAFGEQFDQGLTGAQKENRKLLRDTLAEADKLADQAPGETYLPERVVVIELEQAAGSAEPAPVWPGPKPSTFLHKRDGVWSSCGELTGDAANTVYLAAQDNPDQYWTVDGMARQLVVNALPLGLSC